MTERCIYAYRKRGKAAVFCKLIEGGGFNEVCGHQYLCHQTRRWEVNNSAQCSLRQKAVADKGQPKEAEKKLVEKVSKAKKSTAKAKK